MCKEGQPPSNRDGRVESPSPLHSDELKAKLHAASEERRSLLLRCEAYKSEIEQCQKEVNQLREENQSLQIEINKLNSRIEDPKASKCSSCGGAFSIINRRRHCRKCGQLICSGCSIKSLHFDPYNRPTPVCQPCHIEMLANTNP